MPVLWVGLGNPGAAYAKTRHNVGFLFIDALAEFLEFPPWQEGFSGLVTVRDHSVFGKMILLKPQTTMNLSGKSVSACLSFFNILPPEMIVIHDDLDLPVGKPKLKYGGSHGGHNGLRDINNTLARNDYLRIRMGIDRPANKDWIREYVLGNLPPEDGLAIRATFELILQNIQSLFAPHPSLIFSNDLK